ncbi:pimeloyl-ACP methyl ester esterase BioH [Pantoea sp. Mhis]|uniref:pimeloyl-ACP methyl ester esterase BioH n=1 Tax=Pantoea sp. Mhis TaxID=2576759 RepID=UPI00135AE51E|nr:pimeloyl-ACP methyl ester esterase BioH [Pantoea sp. Mhis]MXP56529.1 pimeloyl-ACP methyl ester esterase BioH [Pantoea sp. Mhis]
MHSLYWNITGKGPNNLVLLHGWGLNSAIWQSIIPLLSPYFKLHLVDLPGFGHSRAMEALTLSEIEKKLMPYLPYNSLLLGWSFGGLVATQIALNYPEYVKALISVASSPCFTARDDWPGIKIDRLNTFQKQLSNDFQRTIERFLELQIMGNKFTKNNHVDIEQLKNVVLSKPMPSVVVLKATLTILREIDFRKALPKLKMPFLRLYGSLDNIVPCCIASYLDKDIPTSLSIVMQKATHIPFLSHPDEFCLNIINYIKLIDI